MSSYLVAACIVHHKMTLVAACWKWASYQRAVLHSTREGATYPVGVKQGAGEACLVVMKEGVASYLAAVV